MIKAQLRFGMINDTGVTTDQSNANVCRSITKSSFHSSCSFSFRLSCRQTSSNCRSKSILITCKSSRRRFRPEYYDSESEDDYFEAFVLALSAQITKKTSGLSDASTDHSNGCST
ncbi:hypothetical protein LguiA_005671 [Lonicera macranthoides]